MEPIRGRVDRFLMRARMHHGGIDMRRYCAAFLDEMRRGLEGRRSSLDMIPTYIETRREVPIGKKVVAMDAGGTNMRAAVVEFDGSGKPRVDDLIRHRMPGTDGEIGKDEFFDALARFVAPLAGKADRIGFCFSYPAEITPECDGRLTFFSKEVKARGVEGQMIGQNLGFALSRSGARAPSRVVLLNDTVATLLAGRNAAGGRRFDGYIGVVCGTGFNAAYVEANAAIRKLPGLDPTGSQIVNTESGGLDRVPWGDIDKEFGATTESPGKRKNEKMISGAYLGPLCLAVARAAARDGVLSSEARRELDALESISTKDVNDFLISPASEDGILSAISALLPPSDSRALYFLMDAVVERAAKLLAIDVAAILLKTGKGLDPRFPVCITVDGTTFWQLRGFHARVECALRSFLKGKEERAFEIVRSEDAPLIGAAIAALTN
jgi:hexokinase